ncbi:BTAD domain-containing putative transcriptional regulator [Lentzea sp. NPDC006480]|uniref:BTAD domain-containing putative transcriptional regulator n=1 Tax=Lentzea sp. NPDC006480 TaxID=3157176 RepID=UPI0033BD884F
MRFGVLGPVEARLPDGGPVAVGGPQVRSLLAMLLMDAGRTVSVGRLVEGLYGADPPADATHALQSQISRLRRGLRGGALVEFGPAGYRLAVSPDSVDAHRFARLTGQGREALAAGDPARAAALLGEALSLWRGPALADVLDAPFAEVVSARLAEERLAGVEDRAEAALALGEHHAVAAELSELVREHPLRERARALLMRALYAGGRQAEALAVFDDARRMLSEELGVDPSAELAEAHLSILRADPAAVPGVRRTPAQLTSFVGRRDELDRLGPLVARSRLVTLTGPGGTGKTRLGVEAGARMSGEVCFVDLSPLTVPAQVAPAVAAALGLPEPGTGVENRLVAALADRPLLVILDNCEHVIAGAAELVDRLLAACPALRVLATSREALGITGEVVFGVGQLAVPVPDAGPAEALACPAVRLFADRAAAVRLGFTVDAATIGPVARICAALDGLPLAIELAAARLRSFTLEEIDARLTDRFRLLSRGARTAAPRHQTLSAVVEWSWELLDPDEQALARRLTVFAGGATLTDTEQVCDLDDVPDALAGLVDKSLVEAHDGRYRMLETVRQFCARRLADAGERDDFLRAHAECFTALAETADERLRGPDQLDWLARLAAERNNLHAALRWAVDAAPALAFRLVAALSWFWWLHGLRGEAAPLAAQLLTAPDSGEPAAEEYALCVVAAAATGADLGEHLDRAAAAIAASDRPLRRPHVVFLLAMAGRRIDVEPARQHRLFDADSWSRAFLRMGDGLLLLHGGRIPAAEAELTAALDGFRSAGDRWGTANALDKLAGIADWAGKRARAAELMDEAITFIEQLGRTEDTADLLTRRADIVAQDGDFAVARAGYERAREFARAVGAPDLRADALRGLADLARWSGDLPEAHRSYEAALAACGDASITAQRIRARVLTGLGWAAGTGQDAARHHRVALEMALRGGNRPAAAGAVDGLAGAALLTGAADRAATLLGAAASLRGAELVADHDVAAVAAEAAGLLGAERYGELYRRGRELTAEEALALAGE